MRSKAEYEEIRQVQTPKTPRHKCETHGLFISSNGGKCRKCDREALSESYEEMKAAEREERKRRKEAKKETVGRKPGRAMSIARLESEIKKLKRENARLSKKLARYQESDFDPEDEAEAIIADLRAQLAKFVPADAAAPPPEEACPNCDAKEIISMTTPSGVVVKSCSKCRTRI